MSRSDGAPDPSSEDDATRRLTDEETPGPHAHRHQPVFAEGELVAERYVVLHYLSEGGMGEVYEARDHVLGELVALKVLHPDVAADAQLVERFKREIQLARQVTHINVCRIFDVGFHRADNDDPPRHFLSMELLAGQTLSQRLRSEGPLTPAAALPLVEQMVAALDAAHQAGVVHRDFKSANVMLVPAGERVRVVVTDFGLAHKHGAGTENSMVGTPAYMAPEQVELGDITPATDVYALGVVLFEMLTGKVPFGGTSALDIASRRLKEPPPTVRSVRPELVDPSGRWEKVVARCLERDPALRFQSARAVLDALRGPRRRWVPFALIGGAALAAAAGLFVGQARTMPAAPMPAAVAATGERPAVAVVGFKNTTGAAEHAWVSTALAEMLTTELAAGGELRTIPGESVARTRTELSLAEADTLAPDTLARLHEKLGVRYVVAGSFTRLGNELRIDVRLQDTATGETLVSAAESGPPDQLALLVTRAGARLRASLGARPIAPAEQEVIVHTSLPSNPEAARYYAEGLARRRAYEAAAARDLFERALALDPDFPQAHSELAAVLSFLGFEQRAREEHEIALRLAQRLPEGERMIIEARHAANKRDHARTRAIYGKLFQRYPDDLEWGIAYADALYADGARDEALKLVDDLRKIPGAADDPRLTLTDMRAAYVKEDYPRILELAHKLRARSEAQGALPFVAEARMMEAGYYYFRGELHEGVKAAGEARRLAVKLGDPDGRAASLESLGLLLLDLGELTRADEVAREALRLAEEQGNERRRWVAWTIIAIAAYAKGDLTGARYGYERLATEAEKVGSSSGKALAKIGLAHVDFLGGQLETALPVLENGLALFRRFAPVRSSAWVMQSLAELHEDRGDLEAARKGHEEVLALHDKLGEGVQLQRSRLALARVHLRAGRAPEAEQLIRKAMGEIDRQRLENDRCHAHLLLALVLDRQGKRAEAMAAWAVAEPLAKNTQAYYLRVRKAEARGLLHATHGTEVERRTARTALEEMVADTRRSGFVGYRLELELALALVERALGDGADAGARLAEVEKDARAHGYGALVLRAQELASPPP